MNKHSITNVIEALGHQVRGLSGDWVQTNCPLAPWRHESGTDKNPSFGVEVNNAGKSRCHCFSCDFNGDLEDLILELQVNAKDTLGLNYTALRDLVEKAEEGAMLPTAWEPPEEDDGIDRPFPEYWLKSFPPATTSPEAMAYLKKRFTPLSVIQLCDLRWDSDRRRVCFPIRDFNGVLMGLHGRAIDKDNQPPYHVYRFKGTSNRHIWLGEHWVDFDKPVVVTESVFDLTRVLQVYRNVVSPLSANVKDVTAKRMLGAYRIVTMYDGDKAGWRARAKLQKMLPKSTFTHINLPHEKDPGDMSIDEIADMIDGLVKVDNFMVA